MPDGAAVHGRSARVRLLGVGRAAALVALAAGINGTVAAFAPGYDGTYLSVGTVAVIACLEGSVIGLAASLAAMLLDWILGGGGFTTASVIAYVAANVIAAAGRFLMRHPMTRTQPMAEGEAGVLIERLQAELGGVRKEANAHRDAAAEMRRAAATEIESKQKLWREERQLLEQSRGEALTAVDQLRTELQKAHRDAERVRATSREKEQELTAAGAAERGRFEEAIEAAKSARAAEEERTGQALEAVSGQLESVGSQLIANQAELATVRNQHAADLAELDRVRAQLAAKVAEHEELRGAYATDEKRMKALSSQLSARVRELEEQLAQLGPELEASRAAAVEAALQRETESQEARDHEARLLAQYEEENATLQRQVETAADTLRAVAAERDELKASAAAQNARAGESSAREMEGLRQIAAERSADASRNADLRREAEERLASSQRDVRALHQRVEELQRRYDAEMRRVAEATAAVVTRESDVRRDLETRLAAAEERAGAFRKQVEDLQVDLNAERIRAVEDKNALEVSWSEKLNRIVANLATDHESDLGDAVSQRETARAESRQMAGRLQDAQRMLEEASATRIALSRDLTAMRKALDEERSRAAAERNELESKLQQIVTHLSTDHEHDVGEIMEQRETARAELRELKSQMHDAQRAFDDSTSALATMNHELRVARAAAEEEKKAREQLDLEWNEKLQKIVTHLASDHEADIGQATVEKEAAKAEARSLNMRLASLQQAVESEREAFRTAQQKWTSIRDSLLEKMQKTEDRYRRTIEQQRREHQTERETIEAELRTLKTSERPFTPEEVAAIRGESFSPIVPVNVTEPMPALTEEIPAAPPTPPAPAPEPPPAERKPLILVVHHNPALRALTRDALNGSGYIVLTAPDGAEGLRMTMAHKPDVVVADVAMPKMDGRELCQAIKGNIETAATKVVLMSGMYTNEIPIGATSADIPPDDILRKPVKPEALKASVSGLLAGMAVRG